MTPTCSSSRALLLTSLLVLTSVHCGRRSRPHARNGDTFFDWRQMGVISPVSDQGQTGDPVAFVVAEAVESLHAIQNGHRVITLSRQQVSDCCGEDFHPKYQGYKCVALIGGLCSALTYTPSAGTCDNKTCQTVGKVTGTGYVQANREDLMVKIIHKTPLSAALDASQESFQTYNGGLYSDPSCSSTSLDHIVQIIGYGTSSAGEDFWIIKNSWGVTWGENGYMRIVRGKNMCGIASEVFYPINHQ